MPSMPTKTLQPLDLVLASPRGFCAGVDRAITIVERALDLYGPPIYVRHEIVHNPHVVERLRQRGAVFVEDVEDIPKGAHVIFSAHGVSPSVVDQAEQRSHQVIDATCPLVTKVHIEAQRYAKKGYHIILIGHPDHVEVQGTVGEAPLQITVVSSVEEVPQLSFPNEQKLAYLTQTTLSIDDTAAIVAALKDRFHSIEAPAKEDICYATQNRQNAVKVLARKVDLVLVVGAPNSSNTVRLVEVSRACGTPAQLLESADDLNPDWLKEVTKVGITAGASAPEDIVQGILSALRAMAPESRIEELKLVDEDVTFALPNSLKKILL